MLKYRLALDLGTTSLGWALLRLDGQGNLVAVMKAGVRIFSDGLNQKKDSSLAVTRRQARAMRRRRDRLLKRKARMMTQLIQYGFFPQDVAGRKALERLNPYALRAKGLDQPLTPGEFARALFHINQRRGFRSNRKTDKGDEAGAMKTAISSLRAQLAVFPLDRNRGEEFDSHVPALLQWIHQEKGGSKPRTVGELLAQRLEKGLGTRATNNGEKGSKIAYELYIERQMVADEFDALWAAQAAFNPTLFHEAARADLRDTLLYQRKLRPVTPGRCTLIPAETRAPRALPSCQRFRILQEVNHLRLLYPDLRKEPLTLAQRDVIVALLERKNKVTFTDMRKALKLDSCVHFNLEDEGRKELKGNATTVALSKSVLFGAAWHDWDAGLQDDIVERLLTEESQAKLMQWLIDRTGVDEARAMAIADVTGLPEGYGSLSRMALQLIVPELQGAVITYDQAMQQAGFSHHSDLGFDVDDVNEDEIERMGERVMPSTGEIRDVVVFKQLPYYGRALRRHVAFAKDKPRNEEERYGKIANPTVHIGLNQVRRVVNDLIRRYGHPAEIVVELARDLKQSREQKKETQKRQKDNQERNKRIRTNIADILGCSEESVKHSDIQKWILWEELSANEADRCCPYSGKQICAAMLLSDQVEIEHILPFSQTLDDSLNNKTVAIRKANRVKGNRSPWQAQADFEALGWRYDEILQRAGQMPPAKRYRFAADGLERWLKEDKDFLARALNDTRYLSRIAKQYLELICPGGVRVIPGQMTALLRAKFGLNDILGLQGEKNRNDHRHHAVDACVIGVTDQGLLKRFADASAAAREKGLERLVENMPLPWPTYWKHVKHAVEHIWVSHKPEHGYEGRMMEETAYGIGKDGQIKQRRKADGSQGREVSHLIRISEPTQPGRHGVDADGQPLPYKGYIGGSNYCIEITRDAKGKWEGTIISTFEAYQIARQHGKERLRHPTLAQNGKALVMRLMIDDCVRLELNGREETMRVVKIGGKGQVFMAPSHEANVDARNKDKADPFSYISKVSGSFQKAKARRVTISPIGELRDPGFKG